MVLAQKFFVGSSLVVEAVELSDRDDLHQVFVTPIIFGEEHELGASAIFAGIVLAVEVFADVDFGSDDCFDTVFFGFAIELHGTVHGGSVGQRDGRHPVLFGLRQEFLDFRESSEEAVVGVNVEVSERHNSEIKQTKNQTYKSWRCEGCSFS